MTDTELIAKVRAAAELVRDGHDFGADGVELDGAAICARAALALVEQFEWHTVSARQFRLLRSEGAKREAAAHEESAARILASLRKAVG